MGQANGGRRRKLGEAVDHTEDGEDSGVGEADKPIRVLRILVSFLLAILPPQVRLK
jgi:hypothetical protein